MTDSPLHVAFLWHMHQPYYKDPFTGLYRLPWVRLHAVKDYLDMLEILKEFPAIKQTFNLVPSLLEQLADYEEGNARDVFLEHALKRASQLTDKEKAFLLENFFLANWETMIKPFPRYYELLRKRGLRFSRAELDRALRYFTEGDFLDLQVLFNLVWIDPLFRERDSELMGLVSKGGRYTEEDKAVVIKKQFEIIKGVVPGYKAALESGHIGLCTSPFYHPILPLLWDTDSAKIATPDIRLPKRRFSHPEDGLVQVRMAMEYFERLFGRKPQGLWPPEGSVSEEVLKALKGEGVRWVATDEDVLSASLRRPMRDKAGNPSEPSVLYRPYRFSDVHIFFRDHRLSDLIGFVYSSWGPRDAARDFIGHLLGIKRSLPKGEHIVSIVLDGENAWEYYSNDGKDFLRYLYEGLSKEERLRTVTFSEYLDEHGDAPPLERLHAGSWIYANFRTWIGHEEDNLAWDHLKDARDALKESMRQHPEKQYPEAWRSIYIAEGSDWNWWYGDEHTSENQKDFDELYRANLLNVYRSIGIEPPHHLYIPILREDRAVAPKTAIRGFISPRIDGAVSGYFEWYQAASLDVGKTGGSMHRAESHLSEVQYGFDLDNLYLRVDPKIPFKEFPAGPMISVTLLKPAEFKLDIELTGEIRAELFERLEGKWLKRASLAGVAVGDILEVALPFREVNARVAEELQFFIVVCSGSHELERCPWRGYICLTVPSADFEAMMWY